MIYNNVVVVLRDVPVLKIYSKQESAGYFIMSEAHQFHQPRGLPPTVGSPIDPGFPHQEWGFPQTVGVPTDGRVTH